MDQLCYITRRVEKNDALALALVSYGVIKSTRTPSVATIPLHIQPDRTVVVVPETFGAHEEHCTYRGGGRSRVPGELQSGASTWH